MYTQSFRKPYIGDTPTFSLAAGAYAVGFEADDTNFPPTVTMTDTVSGVIVTLSQQLVKYVTTLGSTFKFTVTADPRATDQSTPLKEVWVAYARLSNVTP